jgi:hypothetical protein
MGRTVAHLAAEDNGRTQAMFGNFHKVDSAAIMRRMGGLLVTLFFATTITSGASSRDAAPHQPPAMMAPHGERILLIGDSNFFGSLGHTLRTGLERQGHVVQLRGKSSSGLARPEFFDWFAESERLIAEFKPTVIVSMLGANDVQRITWPALDDRVQWKDEAAWRRAYHGRVRQFMKLLSSDGRVVYYLSPTNRGWRIAVDAVNKVREVQRRAATGLAGVEWVDMFPLSSDETGSWLKAGRDANGKVVVYRRSDRIHLTGEGGKLVGERLLAELAKRRRG